MSLRSRLRRMRLAPLSQIEVASPCPVRWEEMEGDEKVRFCQGCGLHVYNLSAMDVEEAAERITQDDDRLCVRFYRRSDGTILTQDCPVGVEIARRRRRKVVEGLAAAVVGAGAAGMFLMPTQGAVARPAARTAALHSAAATGNVPMLRRLMDAGVDPDSRMKTGPTPLMRAAALGQLEAVRLLLERGADVHVRDQDGRTALAFAGAARHRKVVALLRKAGATE
jgi:ankyrin repeat protein